MKFKDIIKTSQRNLLRAKLRTLLTMGAVFIGVFAISLTNGLGSGARAYVDRQLGNLGAENILVVQPKQAFANPVSSDVLDYDPNRQAGQFNVVFLGLDDLAVIQSIDGVQKATPEYEARLEYLARDGKKYQASALQYVDGYRIDMAAGSTVTTDQKDGITIPVRYVDKLGFTSAQDAVGKTVVVGYKDATGKLLERTLTVVGIQERSLLGNISMIFSQKLTQEIYRLQVPTGDDRYASIFVQFDDSISKDRLNALKQRFSDLGYNALTLEDQVGTIGMVINAILIVLNVFGAIALLAATFGIVNTLFMAVKERTSEIGLMKALGANRKTIFMIFSAEAGSIGLWGSVAGITTSIIIGLIANRVASHSFLKNFVGFDLFAFPVLPFLGILVGGIVLALIAGALPSLKASRLDPISALRYE